MDQASISLTYCIPLLPANAIFYPPKMHNALDTTPCPLYFCKLIKESGPGGHPNYFINPAVYTGTAEDRKGHSDCGACERGRDLGP